jgi:hypothetical protein
VQQGRATQHDERRPIQANEPDDTTNQTRHYHCLRQRRQEPQQNGQS